MSEHAAQMLEETRRMRLLLERIWKNYAHRTASLEYELVVLAVPRFPANIEAVAALDLGTVGELLMEFTKARKLDGISSVERDAGEASEAPTAFESPAPGGEAADRPSDSMGEGRDAGGSPEERGDPPHKAYENHASADAVVSMEEMAMEVAKMATPNVRPQPGEIYPLGDELEREIKALVSGKVIE